MNVNANVYSLCACPSPIAYLRKHITYIRYCVGYHRLMAACCVGFSIFAMNRFYDAVRTETAGGALGRRARSLGDSIELATMKGVAGRGGGRVGGAERVLASDGQHSDDEIDDGLITAPLMKHHSW